MSLTQILVDQNGPQCELLNAKKQENTRNLQFDDDFCTFGADKAYTHEEVY